MEELSLAHSDHLQEEDILLTVEEANDEPAAGRSCDDGTDTEELTVALGKNLPCFRKHRSNSPLGSSQFAQTLKI